MAIMSLYANITNDHSCVVMVALCIEGNIRNRRPDLSTLGTLCLHLYQPYKAIAGFKGRNLTVQHK